MNLLAVNDYRSIQEKKLLDKGTQADFESILWSKVLNQMSASEMVEPGNSEKLYTEMLYGQYASELAKSAPILK